MLRKSRCVQIFLCKTVAGAMSSLPINIICFMLLCSEHASCILPISVGIFLLYCKLNDFYCLIKDHHPYLSVSRIAHNRAIEPCHACQSVFSVTRPVCVPPMREPMIVLVQRNPLTKRVCVCACVHVHFNQFGLQPCRVANHSCGIRS